MSKDYDVYLATHIRDVKRSYEWCIKYGILNGLDVNLGVLENRIDTHDTSKFHTAEYEAYDAYFYPSEDDSANDVDGTFNKAWLGHIHKNDHHWQHWVLLNDDPVGDEYEALEMPNEAVVEMFCDWFSFNGKNGNDRSIFDWYAEHKHIMKLHPSSRDLIELLLAKVKLEMDNFDRRNGHV